MSRTLCISNADGQTGHLLTELLLTDTQFKSKIKKVFCLAPNTDKCQDLAKMGAEIVAQRHPHEALGQDLKATGADTIFLIPPAHRHKSKNFKELINAVKDAGIKNTVLLSSAETDLAEDKHQPHLRQFVKFEAETMQLRYAGGTQTGSSQCIIR